MEYKFDMLELKHQVSRVLEFSQGIEGPKVGKILADWLDAKDYWIKAMDGKLIYEYPQEITFELDVQTKKQMKEDFYDRIHDFYGRKTLADFIDSLSYEEFYGNVTHEEHKLWIDGTDDYILVPEKFKVVKAFKFFVNDDSMLKDIQNEASMIIQKNIVSGILCLSVHPLDFLSSSENIHNWRSCHALDGDYRSGNLNYMMDEGTVICYLRAKKMAILPHFPEDVIWNSKKWRVLFHFSNDKNMLFAGRQYPFSSKIGIDLIKNNVLQKILPHHTWTAFHQVQERCFKDVYSQSDILIPSGLIAVGDIGLPIYKLVEDGENTHHFDDILRSSVYTPLYAYAMSNNDFWFMPSQDCTTGETSARTRFKIGEKCWCPACGKGYIRYEDRMLCENCADEYDIED